MTHGNLGFWIWSMCMYVSMYVGLHVKPCEHCGQSEGQCMCVLYVCMRGYVLELGPLFVCMRGYVWMDGWLDACRRT